MRNEEFEGERVLRQHTVGAPGLGSEAPGLSYPFLKYFSISEKPRLSQPLPHQTGHGRYFPRCGDCLPTRAICVSSGLHMELGTRKELRKRMIIGGIGFKKGILVVASQLQDGKTGIMYILPERLDSQKGENSRQDLKTRKLLCSSCSLNCRGITSRTLGRIID